MSEPTITMITPTFGRSSILNCVECVVPQLRPGDEYIIVGDGPVPLAEGLVAQLNNPQLRYEAIPERIGDYGCSAIDHAISKANGQYLMFLGDDNDSLPGAFEIVRKTVVRNPDRPHIFAMWHTGRVLSHRRDLCHVDNQQFVVPNRPDLPKMSPVEKKDWLVSDYIWLNKVIEFFGSVIYSPEIICRLHQQNFGRSF